MRGFPSGCCVFRSSAGEPTIQTGHRDRPRGIHVVPLIKDECPTRAVKPEQKERERREQHEDERGRRSGGRADEPMQPRHRATVQVGGPAAVPCDRIGSELATVAPVGWEPGGRQPADNVVIGPRRQTPACPSRAAYVPPYLSRSAAGILPAPGSDGTAVRDEDREPLGAVPRSRRRWLRRLDRLTADGSDARLLLAKGQAIWPSAHRAGETLFVGHEASADRPSCRGSPITPSTRSSASSPTVVAGRDRSCRPSASWVPSSASAGRRCGRRSAP